MMREGSEEKVLLEYQSIFWPLFILPYYERSHTLTIVGWKNHRPRILKNVKASSAGKVWLTDRHLQVRSFLLRRLLNIRIPLDSIEGVDVSDQDNGLIEIRYRQADMSRLLRFIAMGAPKGIMLLKLDEVIGIWLHALGEYRGRNQPPRPWSQT